VAETVAKPLAAAAAEAEAAAEAAEAEVAAEAVEPAGVRQEEAAARQAGGGGEDAARKGLSQILRLRGATSAPTSTPTPYP